MHELDEFEDGLIAQFKQHPVLRNVNQLTPEDFADLLLQRRFLSLAFTTAYDLAIDLLRDEQGLQIARVILREEYPGSKGYTRSHREDMKEDLLALGISRKRLVESRPEPATVDTITKTLTLISDAGAMPEIADALLLTVLRFWGEVLVSVEYGALWPRMEPRLTSNGENRSLFYYPHHVHDAKARPLAMASPLSSTHSDQLGIRLWQLLDSDSATKGFKDVEKGILALKTGFYDQFLPALERAKELAST